MKTLVAIAFAVVLALTATNAGAATVTLSIGDAYYLGSINDGIPASPADEVQYINYLTTLGPGDPDTQIPAGTGEIYNRVGSTLAGPFPTATTSGAVKDDPANASGTYTLTSSYTYVLGKYDAGQAGSLVWVISGVAVGDTLDLPNTYNGHGISHLSLYNPGGSVPDGGVTLMLLGGALFGIETLRRRFSA
jgi:hypothetical protein